MIWHYAYGNMVIEPQLEAKKSTSEEPDDCDEGDETGIFQYRIRRPGFSIRELYELSLEGASPTDDCKYDRHELQIDSKLWLKATDNLPGTLVCKQLFSEVQPIVYSSCTFSFGDPHSLYAFAKSKRVHLDRVEQLEVHLTELDLLYHWRDVLNSSVMGVLKSLQGVDVAWFQPEEARYRWGWAFEKDISRNLKSFQQHQLKREYTHVLLLPVKKRVPISELQTVAEKMRTELLDYQPRRLSKRTKART